ncbi:MAG: trimeric intracellular cation channel family protein [Ruminococcaceae bacterium]|nr:trimeric intracellular cation channel family protein [Oscillospiraceae bacterium]
MNEFVMLTMEIIGTIAFAVSGALVAISFSLDIFGVAFLGVITAVGGGMLRDLLIGNHPPKIFSLSYLLIIALLTAIIVFVISYINKHRFFEFKEKIERINNFFDAVGLAAFTVTGTQMACTAGFSDKVIFVIFMGMLTGVGGGIFRDVLVSQTPYVLKKHIYAVASIIGSILYYVLSVTFGFEFTGTLISMLTVIVIRLLAAKYLWKLPKIKNPDITEA